MPSMDSNQDAGKSCMCGENPEAYRRGGFSETKHNVKGATILAATGYFFGNQMTMHVTGIRRVWRGYVSMVEMDNPVFISADHPWPESVIAEIDKHFIDLGKVMSDKMAGMEA